MSSQFNTAVSSVILPYNAALNAGNVLGCALFVEHADQKCPMHALLGTCPAV